MQYALHGVPENHPQITLGQMNWPFGYEVPRSSSEREPPERSEFLRSMFPGERDRGIKISAPLNSRLQWELGAFSGTGTENRPLPFYNAGSFADNNSRKDLVGHARYRVNDSLSVNLSGYLGRAGGTNITQGASMFFVPLQNKRRWGADFQWYSASLPVSLMGEYVKARDPYISSSATSASAVRSLDRVWLLPPGERVAQQQVDGGIKYDRVQLGRGRKTWPDQLKTDWDHEVLDDSTKSNSSITFGTSTRTHPQQRRCGRVSRHELLKMHEGGRK